MERPDDRAVSLEAVVLGLELLEAGLPVELLLMGHTFAPQDGVERGFQLPAEAGHPGIEHEEHDEGPEYDEKAVETEFHGRSSSLEKR